VTPDGGGGDPDDDWIARSTGPDVVYAFGFDDQSQTLAGVLPDSQAQYATWSSQQHASGAGSLHFRGCRNRQHSVRNTRTQHISMPN
jgi:hypothetical protein